MGGEAAPLRYTLPFSRVGSLYDCYAVDRG